jgi:ribose transport system permease protein
VNVWGSVFGILILAVGISGIQLLGGAFFVEPLFNGTTLVVAIALAAFAQRRRAVVKPPPRDPQPPPSEPANAAGVT